MHTHRFLCLAFIALIIGLSPSSSQVNAATKRTKRYQCYDRQLCLGMPFAATAARYRKRGYKPIQRIQALICRFYRPKGANAQQYPCQILHKGRQQLFLVGHRGKVVFAYISASPSMPAIKGMRQRWGRETRKLRSLEGVNLFWTSKVGAHQQGISAFFPFAPRDTKIFLKMKPKGVFLFAHKNLRNSSYGASLAAILKIAAYAKRHKGWPQHCFHTICLGSPREQALHLLKSQGYKLLPNAPVKGCAGFRQGGQKRTCNTLRRKASGSFLRMVWEKGRLIYAQGERLSPTPNVRTIREVWKKETHRLWLKDMLFLQWYKKKKTRYILSIPLYGSKRSKKPIAQRRAVGFLLLDWPKIRKSKVGKALRQHLKFP